MGQALTTIRVRTRADCARLAHRAEALETEVWSKLGFLNFTSAHAEHYDALLAEFPDHQLCLVDEAEDELIAVASSVPLDCRGVDALPSEGWDWMVERAATHRDRPPNMLGALAISVLPEHRSKGYARTMIAALRALAVAKGLDGLIAPVRPSAKAQHPFVTIDDYIGWRDGRGRPFDPWLRSHLGAGGQLVGACSRSMVVDQPLGFWRRWGATDLDRSGLCTVGGALTPVRIDLDDDRGRYEEPNVWVRYDA